MTLDYEDAKKVAIEQGQFLLLYFTEDEWCEPCDFMERETWSSYEVQELQQRFVSVRFEADQLSRVADMLEVQALPTTIILDAYGHNYMFFEGYLSKAEIVEKLSGFPADMREIYQAESVALTNDSYRASLRLGDLYQRISYEAGSSVAGRLLFYSDIAYRKSKRQLVGLTDAPLGLSQRLDLLLIENQLLRGNFERSLSRLQELQSYFVAANQPLGNYLFTMAYRLAGDTEKAREHYQELRAADNNQRWLARLARW